MESEQNILDATEYILMALNNITNYNEFLEYKEELITAIIDIKKSITNLIKINKTNKSNTSFNNINKENKSISNTKIEKDKNSYLSSILGLKFNYDPYFDENQLRDLTQNEEILKNKPYIKNDIISNKNNKNQNKYGFNKSLRNKIKSNNNKNDNLIQSNINNDSRRINQTDNNNTFLKNKKKKYNLIADIIMKINTEEYINEILTKLFGENLTDKLMSNDVSDGLLEAIQDSIKEIEKSKKNDEINKKYNTNEEIEEKPKKYPLEILMKKNDIFDTKSIKKSVSTKRFNSKKNNNIYKEFNFVKSLRKNGNINLQKNDDINNLINNKYKKKEKPFISATCPYGNYFDSPLQRGGMSKLNSYNKNCE